ncbi:hypothetical protein AB0M39_20415 [Streptomyces sp. NPDC051907]|uniref:hypothetical protein n=1 Tax=Streptomyces sp. NPDC051907 TaxID=3155284 RepID=UPI0034335646
MTTPWPPRRVARRPLAPRVAAPREPVDLPGSAAVSYGAGRRAWTPAPSRRPSRAHASTRGGTRGTRTRPTTSAGGEELAEWERIDQLLADDVPGAGAVYDPDADDVVQAELAANAAAAAAREAELREAARLAPTSSRRCASWARWSRPSPVPGTKPSGTNSPGARAGTSRPTSTDGSRTPWPRASGTTATRPPARKQPGLLTPPVLAHAALLAELARLVPGADVDQLAFAARLATTEPEAAGALAGFLTRARS